jgi:hypothetical protein
MKIRSPVSELLHVNAWTYIHREVNRCIAAIFHCERASNYRLSYLCCKLSFPVLREQNNLRSRSYVVSFASAGVALQEAKYNIG